MMNKTSASIILLTGITSYIYVNADNSARGAYFGVFGGGGAMSQGGTTQDGVAYKYGDYAPVHGSGHIDANLVVHQEGKFKQKSAIVGGLQFGYEWGSRNFIKPALEFEGIYLGSNFDAHTSNPYYEETYVADTANNRANHASLIGQPLVPADGIAAGLHQFDNRANLNSAILMLGGTLRFDTLTKVTPYVGVGVGIVRTSLNNATSYQVVGGSLPPRTEYTSYTGSGVIVNHFNSRQDDSDISTAFQFKVGLLAQLSKNLTAFLEYRYLYVSSSNYEFGSTNYPGYHVATSPWLVSLDSLNFHTGLLGLKYTF